MKEDDFKKEIKLFIEELNNLLSIECLPIFDNECPYPCCFNEKNKTIVFNYELLNETSDSALKILGNDYLKYYILHEYGHIVYNEQVKEYINKIMNKEQIPLLNSFITNYNSWIENISKNYPELEILNCEHYWMKQYLSACEFMADYFVIKQIKSKINYLNFNSFKLWRAKSVLERYNHCEENNSYHFEHLNYFHIPETMEHYSIKFENDSIINLIDLSLNNSLKSLILTYNQSNNIKEYNATKFNEKISGIIEELNQLR